MSQDNRGRKCCNPSIRLGYVAPPLRSSVSRPDGLSAPPEEACAVRGCRQLLRFGIEGRGIRSNERAVAEGLATTAQLR